MLKALQHSRDITSYNYSSHENALLHMVKLLILHKDAYYCGRQHNGSLLTPFLFVEFQTQVKERLCFLNVFHY